MYLCSAPRRASSRMWNECFAIRSSPGAIVVERPLAVVERPFADRMAALTRSEHPELQRLGNVIGADPVVSRKIGDAPRDLPDAIVAARAQRQTRHRRSQHAQRRGL